MVKVGLTGVYCNRKKDEWNECGSLTCFHNGSLQYKAGLSTADFSASGMNGLFTGCVDNLKNIHYHQPYP